MSNKVDVLRACALRLAIAGTLAISVAAPNATADIDIEELGDSGERFNVEVRDEPIADVMDELSERFDFNVDGYPLNWSDEPISFNARGDVERILRKLLKDTSHVVEYHTDRETKITRIAALKLLNEGEEGFVPAPLRTDTSTAATQANSPERSGYANGTAASSGAINSGAINSGANRNQSTDLNEPDLPINRAGGNGGTANVASNAGQTSGLSQSLEARARQTSAAAQNQGTASATTAGANTPAAANPDMQALTQKALQDVQGLAEALRNAEGR